MYRLLLVLVGLLLLTMGVSGIVLAVTGDGVAHFIMEGLRGLFFTVLGMGIIAAGVMCDSEFARSALRDLLRDMFSRRNLVEFAAFWVVVGVAVMVLLTLRP